MVTKKDEERWERIQKYKTGTVVRLKSGGPNMTVIDEQHLGDIRVCSWIDDEGKPQQESFPLACLTQ